MDIINLDTNIFVSENFLLGNMIKKFFELAQKKEVQIVLTKITINEVKKKYRDFIELNKTKFNHFKNHKPKTLKNDETFRHLYEIKMNTEEICERFNKAFDDQLIKSHVIVLDYETINIKEIFESYFTQKPPFSNGKKRSEFLDAFIIETLEIYSNKIKKNILCFSNDSDFLTYTPKSHHIKISNEYSEYISKLSLIVEDKELLIEQIEDQIDYNLDTIKSQLTDWITEELGYIDIYYNVISDCIYDVDIDSSKFVIDYENYLIIDISEGIITLEALFITYHKSNVLIDDVDTFYYDSDDGQQYAFEQKYEEISQRQPIKLLLTFEYNEDDYEDCSLEIASINNDEKITISNNQNVLY